MASTTDMRPQTLRDLRNPTPTRVPQRDYPPTDDPDVIMERIRQTRADMGLTIDQIQERLSPENLKQQATETIREATIGKVEQMTYNAERKARNWRDSAMHTMKENPIPLALIGIGLGWMLFGDRDDNGRSQQSFDRRYDPYGYRYYDERYLGEPGQIQSSRMRAAGMRASDTVERFQERASMMGESAGDMRESLGEQVSHTAEELQHRAEDLASGIQHRASDLRDTVKETTSNIKQTTSNVAHQTREQAEQAAAQAQQQMEELRHTAELRARQAKRTFWNTMEENPLAVGAAALALGTIVGLVIPATRYENELMGETRDRLVDEAKSTAQEAVEKAKVMAGEAGQAAKEAAKETAEELDIKLPGAEGERRTGTTGTGSTGTGTTERATATTTTTTTTGRTTGQTTSNS